jgi:hypothetical protein
MSIVRFFLACALPALGACSTPYSPAVPVFGSHEVGGIGRLLAASGTGLVDVIMVHGMGSHNLCTAEDSVSAIAAALRARLPDAMMALDKPKCSTEVQAGPIQTYEKSVDITGGQIHFTAIVWSPLTAGLKRQLDYNNTSKPIDCTQGKPCKPLRARLNGEGIDFLLNDALADALIYQGLSKARIRAAVAESIAQVLRKPANTAVPLVLVTESLGSKIVFDALVDILKNPKGFKLKQTTLALAQRIRLVFMGANQLPLLGLADQDGKAAVQDTMSAFFSALHAAKGEGSALQVVAFNDPNDLLSFRLQPSLYTSQFKWIQFSDVLVSNSKTLFGLLENPYLAHIKYLDNPDVINIIACGTTRWEKCK